MKKLYALVCLFLMAPSILIASDTDPKLAKVEAEIIKALQDPKSDIDQFLMTKEEYKVLFENAEIPEDYKKKTLARLDEHHKTMTEVHRDGFKGLQGFLKEYNIDLNWVYYHKQKVESGDYHGLIVGEVFREFSTKTAKYDQRCF